MSPSQILEAMLFASSGPLKLEELAEAGGWTRSQTEEHLAQLESVLSSRAIELRKIAGAYQLLTRSECAPYVERILQVQNKKRLTRAQLEVLSVIAYKQPITRAGIEAARGLNSDRSLSQLVDLELVAQTGRAELPGRPFLFGTTSLFLEHFGLPNLGALPELAWDEEPQESPEPFRLEQYREEEKPIRSREMEQLAEDISGPSSSLSRLLSKIRRQEEPEDRTVPRT